MIDLRARARSFRFAFRGIATLLRSEPNARIHLLAAAVALAAGFAFRIASGEWLAVVLAIGAVWVAESLNTAIEALCDAVSPEFDARVEKAKDVAAAGVLLAALAALAVAALVFGPHLLALLR